MATAAAPLGVDLISFIIGEMTANCLTSTPMHTHVPLPHPQGDDEAAVIFMEGMVATTNNLDKDSLVRMFMEILGTPVGAIGGGN